MKAHTIESIFEMHIINRTLEKEFMVIISSPVTIITKTLQQREEPQECESFGKETTVPAGTLDALRFAGTFAVSGNFESETFYLARNIGLIKNEVESNDHKRIKELGFSDVGR